jgi:hypothetical protein
LKSIAPPDNCIIDVDDDVISLVRNDAFADAN